MVEQARAGDRQALERLLLEYGPTISSHIKRRFPSAIRGVVGVEDILQQTLLHAYYRNWHTQGTFAGSVRRMA